ncbi:MAG: c-type cytochrome [Bacteroidota bacterium]
MKRSLIVVLAVSVLVACGGSGSKEKKADDKAESKTTDLSQNPDYQNGLSLVAKSNCLTCHNVDQVVTGPPYREIANKYGDMPDTIIAHLAKKIISGGNGVWGQIFMTPHPDVSQADAEAMVKYILLLKK